MAGRMPLSGEDTAALTELPSLYCAEVVDKSDVWTVIETTAAKMHFATIGGDDASLSGVKPRLSLVLSPCRPFHVDECHDQQSDAGHSDESELLKCHRSDLSWFSPLWNVMHGT